MPVYSLVNVIVTLFLCGIGLWVLAQFPNLNATIAKLIRIVIIVAASVVTFFYLLNLLIGYSSLIHIPVHR